MTFFDPSLVLVLLICQFIFCFLSAIKPLVKLMAYILSPCFHLSCSAIAFNKSFSYSTKESGRGKTS